MRLTLLVYICVYSLLVPMIGLIYDQKVHRDSVSSRLFLARVKVPYHILGSYPS